MQLEDMILVSVDDHVVEPPDIFEGRLSKKAAERAPHVVKLPNGADAWMFEGSPLPNVGLNAVAGRVPEEYGVDPLAFAQMRPGCYDIDERIRDMNVNGVLGSLNFPSLAGFTGQLFTTCDDKDIALELLQAYNDWHIEDWCGTHPGRMIPLSVPPVWDPQLMAAEVRPPWLEWASSMMMAKRRPRCSLPISSRIKGNFCTVLMMIFFPLSMKRRRSPERSAWPTVADTWAYCLMVALICLW